MGENNSDKGQKTGDVPPINFATFVLSLAASAEMHLGLIPNPATNKTEVSLLHAKQTIEILEMLKEKTKGNLDDAEGNILDQLLFELRMQFVEKKKKSY